MRTMQRSPQALSNATNTGLPPWRPGASKGEAAEPNVGITWCRRDRCSSSYDPCETGSGGLLGDPLFGHRARLSDTP